MQLLALLRQLDAEPQAVAMCTTGPRRRLDAVADVALGEPPGKLVDSGAAVWALAFVPTGQLETRGPLIVIVLP